MRPISLVVSQHNMRPWKTLSSRVVHADNWISLRAEACESADGTVIEPYYVLEEREWVVIFALDENDDLLLVRQYRHAGRVICFELPGGGVEDGETPLDAAIRELREESGCSASEWISAGALFANPARQTNRMYVFLATGLDKTSGANLDESEDIAATFVSNLRVQEMIRTGEFPQALHVAAFYLAHDAILQRRGLNSQFDTDAKGAGQRGR
jgi:ADP-ribose pyrophosphatase